MAYIEDLDDTTPDGATDKVSVLDNHIREIKTALLTSFPNLGAAEVTGSAAEINSTVDKLAAVEQDDLDALNGLAADILQLAGADAAGGIVFEDRVGNANGVASLDSGGKIPEAQMPEYGFFESGTTMIFAQAAPPSGWTEVTTTLDAILRLTGSAAYGSGSGGTNTYHSTFKSTLITAAPQGYSNRGSGSYATPSTTHFHYIDLDVKYINVLKATKD